MPAKIEYKNPAATASMIVESWFGRIMDPRPEVYLVKRKHEPCEGMWALPGGFLECDKGNLEEAAVRELKEETPFVAKISDLELLCVNSSPTRDPRGHVIDHIYIVKDYTYCPHANGDYDDAAEGRFFPLDNLPQLAFDHGEVIKKYETWRLKNVK